MEEQEKLVDEFDADLEQAELQEDKEVVEEEEFPADIEGDLPPSMRIGISCSSIIYNKNFKKLITGAESYYITFYLV